jgi:hypothetical protein
VEVDKEFLRHVVEIVDATIAITRDKFVWQNLAIPLLGENWEATFRAAQSDPKFIVGGEIQLAELKKMRDAFVSMSEKALKGESVPQPTDRIN